MAKFKNKCLKLRMVKKHINKCKINELKVIKTYLSSSVNLNGAVFCITICPDLVPEIGTVSW